MTKRNKIIIIKLNDEFFSWLMVCQLKNEDRNNNKKNKRFSHFFSLQVIDRTDDTSDVEKIV